MSLLIWGHRIQAICYITTRTLLIIAQLDFVYGCISRSEQSVRREETGRVRRRPRPRPPPSQPGGRKQGKCWPDDAGASHSTGSHGTHSGRNRPYSWTMGSLQSSPPDRPRFSNWNKAYGGCGWCEHTAPSAGFINRGDRGCHVSHTVYLWISSFSDFS